MKTLLSSPVLFICMIMILMLSCEKKIENTCGVDNPVKDLTWLKDQVGNIQQMDPDTYKYYYFCMATYRGQTVFLPGLCDPAANYIPVILDCSGERIGIIGNGEDMIPWDDLLDRRVIWQPANSACVFRE